MLPPPPPLLLLLLLLLLAPMPTSAFRGAFFSGSGDDETLELLDQGRRAYSSSEFEFQSVNMLYKGTLDGLLEGPTWGAWWTQNSCGRPASVASPHSRGGGAVLTPCLGPALPPLPLCLPPPQC